MFQNKTNTLQILAVSLLLFCGSSAFADQSCKLSSDDKEQFALAHAWKNLDGNLNKKMYSVEWSFEQRTKAKFQKHLEARANNRFPKCGSNFESDLVHLPKGIGAKNGIKRYQEIFLKPQKEKPEIYFSILNNMTCPTAADLKVRDEYKQAQAVALDNMTYIIYHRMVSLRSEATRHADDISVLSELKSQLVTLRPEVIRVGADLEFLKRADAFGTSLETALKTKPEIMCQIDLGWGKAAFDTVYEAVKPDSFKRHVK